VKAIFKLFTQSWFLVLIGLALLSLAIWNGGPYLAFGSMKPLESVVSRLVAILVLVVLWTLWVQIRQYRARKAGDQLAKDVSFKAVKAGERAAEPGSAEAAQLRARFEEAIAALRSSQGKSVNLYELPWYIIIGPPGAGKTTAIANSGLNFPLSKKFGKEALRGVGGTRNCDWWFTDEAILLDTAGRYTTQDSDAESDHAGWIEFLNLLRKHRSRRPINGVIVAISASDLLSASDGERRRHVEAVRRRLEELTRELRISLPVYFVLTKLDLIAGFTEFFDDLNQEGRARSGARRSRSKYRGRAQLPAAPPRSSISFSSVSARGSCCGSKASAICDVARSSLPSRGSSERCAARCSTSSVRRSRAMQAGNRKCSCVACISRAARRKARRSTACSAHLRAASA
jgi:type VI secretion system protein ImpL